MEGFVNIFFFILLIIGIVFFMFRKARKIGIGILIFTLFFWFILPEIYFVLYKYKTIGNYQNKYGNRILIDNDDNYKILYKDSIISEGEIQYNKIDIFSFEFDNNPDLKSLNEGEIINSNNENDIYLKSN